MSQPPSRLTKWFYVISALAVFVLAASLTVARDALLYSLSQRFAVRFFSELVDLAFTVLGIALGAAAGIIYQTFRQMNAYLKRVGQRQNRAKSSVRQRPGGMAWQPGPYAYWASSPEQVSAPSPFNPNGDTAPENGEYGFDHEPDEDQPDLFESGWGW